MFPMSKHIDYCLSQSDRSSRSDGIREKAKNKLCQLSCAKCHQSILNGQSDLPEVRNTSISASPCCDRTSRSDIIRERAKNKDCANRNRHVPSAIGSQQAQSCSRCRSTSIIVSPNPIGAAVQTVFAKRLKINCANCHVPSATNRFSMGNPIYPRSETHRSVPLPIAIGPAVRTLFAKKNKNKDCANRNRHVPSAIGSQQAQSYSRCRSTSIIVSPNPIGPVVQTVFAKRLKIKCANRHVPSATNRFSMGTVIFPRSNHID